MEKAQSTIEFMVLIGVFMFFMLIFMLVIWNNIDDISFRKRDLAVREIASSIQDEILLASQAKDGYSRPFKLGTKLGDKDYNATIVDDFIYVYTLDKKHATALPVYNVSGQIRLGNNTIRKDLGRVYLNS